MRPSLLPAFEQLISKPRLDSYRGYFHASADEAVGLYMWNGEVSSCLAALLSYFEIALRNNTHRSMSTFYSRGAASSIHWYDNIWRQLRFDTQNKIDKIRYERASGGVQVPRVPAPSPDEIVSRVTFGFWPAILGVLDQRYVMQILPGVFPNHPLSANPRDWLVAPRRKAALSFIYELNTLRNRIAHHEPLWKFSTTNDTSLTPPHIPASTNQAETMSRFQRLLGLFDAGVSALSPDLQADLRCSSWRRRLDFLLSDRALVRYRKLKHVPAARTLTPAQFRDRYSLLVKANQPVRVGRSSGHGIFDPE